LVPRRKRRTLHEALTLVEKDDKHRFEKAEQLLVQALTSGLKKDDVSDARFALAYVRARSKNYAEALAVAEELCASDPTDREAAYLRFWLLARLEDDEKIEKIYEEKAELLGDLLDTKLIAGITFLRRARMHWAKHNVEQAVRYFEQLQPLNVLKEEVPQQIDASIIVFGIVALFEGNLEEAQNQFSKARSLSKKEDKSNLLAEIGGLLCQWKKKNRPDIDTDLSKIVSQLHNGSQVANTAKSDEKWLCRNVCLWHCVSLLFTWLRLPAGSKLKKQQWEDLQIRLDRVREQDKKMGDPDLLWGLLRYFFFFDQENERKLAKKRIEKACQNNINVPEVLTILNREDKLEQAYKQGLTHYLTLVREWLKSSDVPQALRQELLERLQANERFRALGDIDIAADEEFAPSIADIQFRVSNLSRRISTIVKPRLRDKTDANSEMVDEIMGKLKSVSKVLSKNTQALEKTEQKMMLITGEFLLAEEDGATLD
jgi:tetratricopeptide (TPR) repeat protein